MKNKLPQYKWIITLLIGLVLILIGWLNCYPIVAGTYSNGHVNPVDPENKVIIAYINDFALTHLGSTGTRIKRLRKDSTTKINVDENNNVDSTLKNIEELPVCPIPEDIEEELPVCPIPEDIEEELSEEEETEDIEEDISEEELSEEEETEDIEEDISEEELSEEEETEDIEEDISEEELSEEEEAELPVCPIPEDIEEELPVCPIPEDIEEELPVCPIPEDIEEELPTCPIPEEAVKIKEPTILINRVFVADMDQATVKSFLESKGYLKKLYQINITDSFVAYFTKKETVDAKNTTEKEAVEKPAPKAVEDDCPT